MGLDECVLLDYTKAMVYKNQGFMRWRPDEERMRLYDKYRAYNWLWMLAGMPHGRQILCRKMLGLVLSANPKLLISRKDEDRLSTTSETAKDTSDEASNKSSGTQKEPAEKDNAIFAAATHRLGKKEEQEAPQVKFILDGLTNDDLEPGIVKLINEGLEKLMTPFLGLHTDTTSLPKLKGKDPLASSLKTSGPPPVPPKLSLLMPLPNKASPLKSVTFKEEGSEKDAEEKAVEEELLPVDPYLHAYSTEEPVQEKLVSEEPLFKFPLEEEEW